MASMPHRSRTTIAIAIGCALVVTGSRSRADSIDPSPSEEARATTRWMPGFSLQTGFLAEQRDGYAESVERGIHEGESTALFGHFGASVDLSTPEIPSLPISTRFFARADVSVSVDEKESLATESDPGDPLNDPDANLEGGPVDGILGTGTTLRVQAEPLILSGGLGLSFATEIADRTVRFKPSLEWMYQRDELALRFADIETVGSNPDQCQPCRATSLQNETTKGFHSLGPGFEVEVDTGRFRSVVFSFFTQFRALRILGDREAAMLGTSAWYTRTVERVDGQTVITSTSPAAGRDDSTVLARYRREPWGYFAAAGVRIVWNPE